MARNDDRAARLAEALRANLRRRKAQARAACQPGTDDTAPAPGDPAEVDPRADDAPPACGGDTG